LLYREAATLAKDLNMILLFDVYRNILTEKQMDVIDLYYNEDFSLAEISEHLGITRQGVRDHLKRGEAVLTELEQKLGLVKRYSALKRAADALKEEIEALEKDSQAEENPWIAVHLARMKALLLELEQS
jgi:predicted DNA-binding protein YlxM (UPF0122 family)